MLIRSNGFKCIHIWTIYKWKINNLCYSIWLKQQFGITFFGMHSSFICLQFQLVLVCSHLKKLVVIECNLCISFEILKKMDHFLEFQLVSSHNMITDQVTHAYNQLSNILMPKNHHLQQLNFIWGYVIYLNVIPFWYGSVWLASIVNIEPHAIAATFITVSGRGLYVECCNATLPINLGDGSGSFITLFRML